jgi:hypothetical protein
MSGISLDPSSNLPMSVDSDGCLPGDVYKFVTRVDVCWPFGDCILSDPEFGSP